MIMKIQDKSILLPYAFDIVKIIIIRGNRKDLINKEQLGNIRAGGINGKINRS